MRDISIDEFSVRRGVEFRTIVVDLGTSRIVHVGRGRGCDRQRAGHERAAIEGLLHEGGHEEDLDAADKGRRRKRVVLVGRTGKTKQGAKACQDGRHAHGTQDGNTRMVRLPFLYGEGRGHQQQNQSA